MRRDIVLVGATTLDYVTSDQTALISGGGARAAIAAALACPNSPDTRVVAVTTLADNKTPTHEAIRTAMKELKIEILSQGDARVPVSIFRNDYGNTPSSQVRDNQHTFAPSEIAKTKTLNPAAAVFIGGPMVFNIGGMTAFAEQMTNQGAVVILDINPRKSISQDISTRWAQHAQIIKIGDEDVTHYNCASSRDTREIAERNTASYFLEKGAAFKKGIKLVLVTHGKNGATAYWKENNELKQLSVPVCSPLEIKNEVGAGDAFDAGLAVALREMNITPDNITISATMVEKMVKRAHIISGQTLTLYNSSEELRPSAMNSIIRGPLETILRSLEYPIPRKSDDAPNTVSSSARFDFGSAAAPSQQSISDAISSFQPN
ncbi:MAG: hypothetical protein A3F11_01300 [Gammaproteobacteria bacterium RIFCSPHIGHO2_12_FULL_37_14]|nr:MAG: hypothetical protein A3F11_01300 [Gammaproteobacteria bacterium RIFCSPHIGHO2_12_FULL_37_14]